MISMKNKKVYSFLKSTKKSIQLLIYLVLYILLTNNYDISSILENTGADDGAILLALMIARVLQDYFAFKSKNSDKWLPKV